MSLYKLIKNKLSLKNQGKLIVSLFRLGIKPTVNKSATSPFKKGIVVFSADFEMAWAFRYSKKRAKIAVEMGLRERENFPLILELFNKYNIPVTWATVGHLFLDKCEKDVSNIAHSDMPRPDFFENKNWNFNAGDWYQHDPCTNLGSSAAWYAPDLIDKIINSNTRHEIGSHTFSHIDCTYKNCSKELMDKELEKCLELGKKKGIIMESHVFPGGTFGNYESLKEKGFTNYRMPSKFQLDIPFIDKFGLVRIPSALGLDKDPYLWQKEQHILQIKKLIEKTIKYKQVCHLWFHPSMDPWYLREILPSIVKLVSDQKNMNAIDIMTMGELANLIKKND